MMLRILNWLIVVLLLVACSPGTAAAPTSMSAPTHYRSEGNHVEVDLPAGWAVSEGPEQLAQPFEGLLAFNSWGQAKFWARQVESKTDGGEYSYSRETILSQLPVDGAYIVLTEFSGGPKQPFEDYGPEYDQQDLSSLWSEQDCRVEGAIPIQFYKWGWYLSLGVYCSPDVSDRTMAEVNQLLESWRFDKVPAGDFGWATVNARELLPAKVHPASFPILTTGHPASTVQQGKVVRMTRAAIGAGEVVEVTFFYRWEALETGPMADYCPPESCHWWRFDAHPDGGVRLVEEGGAELPGENEQRQPSPEPTSPATPIPEQVTSLPSKDETILTIHNKQLYSGRVGEPKPDWIAWGAQAFSMTTDGDIWILDYAAQPQRLIHLEKPYESTQLISLEGLVVGATDVEAASDAIWVLGIASQPARVVKLSTDGKLLESYDLPRGLWPEDGLSGIALAEDGALLVELEGGAKLYQLFDQNGQVAPHLVEGYTFDGRILRTSVSSSYKQAFIYVGSSTITVNSQLHIGALRVIGAVPDDTFYAEMYVMPEAIGSNGVRQILHYSMDGLLLGVAYPHPAEFYAEQDVVIGPDGLLYQLVSNPDHSVQIVRLGFSTGEYAMVPPAPSPTPTPIVLTPLLPTWTVTPAGASDLDLARHTLLEFFTLLHNERYSEAVSLYGGSYDDLRVQNPDVSADDYAALWQATCGRQTPCLLVSRIVEENPISQDEFQFIVEFVWLDGTLFKLGPCCGATEAEMPPVWQFPYTVKKIDGMFKVMAGPVYIP